MNSAIAIPMILAMFILNCIPNDNDIMLKSSTTGSDSPKLSPYPSHHRKSIPDANSPSSPPTTIPANMNNINTHIFLSLVAMFIFPPITFCLFSFYFVYIIYC